MSVDIVGWEMFRTTNLPVVGATVNVRTASTAHPNSTGVLSTQMTNANGQYSFTGLADGDYDVDITYAGVTKSYKGLTKFVGVVQASNFASQSTSTVLIAPSGGAGRPTFRALTNADLPATLTRVIQVPSDILDTNGNEIIGVVPAASAVNNVRIYNKATGVNPIIDVVGDANLGLNFGTQGSGRLQWGGADLFTAPTTWTPTLTQVGAAVLSVAEARWFQIYKMIFAYCRCQVSSGVGTTANNIVFGGFPVAARSVVADKILGQYVFIDSSAGSAAYSGQLVMVGDASSGVGVVDLTSDRLGKGFAFAAGDIFSLLLQYEVA